MRTFTEKQVRILLEKQRELSATMVVLKTINLSLPHETNLVTKIILENELKNLKWKTQGERPFPTPVNNGAAVEGNFIFIKMAI